IADEGGEKPELEGRQQDVVAAGPDGALREVDRHEAVRVRLGRSFGALAASQVRVHAREELLTPKRLGYVVVRTAAETANLVELLGAGCEHHHRHVAQLANPLQRLPAVKARHL